MGGKGADPDGVVRVPGTTKARIQVAPTDELRDAAASGKLGRYAESGDSIFEKPFDLIHPEKVYLFEDINPRLREQDQQLGTDLVSSAQQYWQNHALDAANINITYWRPIEGFSQNIHVFLKVYAYYANLYNQNPNLRWAAMSKLAGGEVLRGLIKEITPIVEAHKLSAKWDFRGDLGGTGYQGGSAVIPGLATELERELLEMQKDIFFDLAWQHQAFVERGLSALEAANKSGELSNELLEAWRGIASGDETKVRTGNYALLKREQSERLKKHYQQIQELPDIDMIPKTMSGHALSPIPGGRPFSEVVPGGDITDFSDRWRWITEDMIPAFERLDPCVGYLAHLFSKEADLTLIL